MAKEERGGDIVRGWNKKGKGKVILLFAIVSVISLIRCAYDNT